MFASDLDPASKQQLARGARLVELLKQKQADPLPVEQQVVSIWAGTTGQLDSIPVEDVQRFEADFLDHLRRTKQELLDAIRETGKFEDSTESALQSEIDSFKAGFQPRGDAGTTVESSEDGDDALDSDQEQIVRQKR